MPIVLSCDPGAPNFGFSVIDFKTSKKGKLEPKILELGILNNVLRDIKHNPKAELKKMSVELLSKTKLHKPEFFIAERFLARSFRTNLAESIPMMLGYILKSLPPKTIVHLTPAVTWKAAAKKVFNLKKLDTIYKEVICTPHELDAVLLAFFGTDALYLLNDADFWEGIKCQIYNIKNPKKSHAT